MPLSVPYASPSLREGWGNDLLALTAIVRSRLFLIPGKDYLTAVPDRRYRKAVLDFLSEGDGQLTTV